MNLSGEPVVKPQIVRLMDIFLIGPLMIAGGILLVTGKHRYIGSTLASTGLTTIIYNAINYRRVKELTAAQEKENG